MHNEWRQNDRIISAAELAAFTIKHAHEWYDASEVFTITEDSGEIFNGGLESIHREEAFKTAADYFGINYDIIYNAWLDEIPIAFSPRTKRA